jgi:hypothetical protein
MDFCPVCGYLDPDNPPVDSAICACCGTQFGYHDAGNSHIKLRKLWIDKGCPWSHPRILPPLNWSPSRQLADAELMEPEKVPA